MSSLVTVSLCCDIIEVRDMKGINNSLVVSKPSVRGIVPASDISKSGSRECWTSQEFLAERNRNLVFIENEGIERGKRRQEREKSWSKRKSSLILVTDVMKVVLGNRVGQSCAHQGKKKLTVYIKSATKLSNIQNGATCVVVSSHCEW